LKIQSVEGARMGPFRILLYLNRILSIGVHIPHISREKPPIFGLERFQGFAQI